jgi:integrase
MGRRRRINANLPPNLYCSKKGPRFYYRYRNPESGKETGVGTDKQAAIRAAHQLNAELRPTPVDLLARVRGTDRRMDSWLDRYAELLQGRDLSPATLLSYRKLLKAIRAELGELELSAIDTRRAAEFIGSYAATPTMAKQLRSRLIDIYDEAIREGLVDHNPVTVTRTPRIKVMRERLSLEHLTQILKAAESLPTWVGNSLLLAVITGQRLDDIGNMKFADVSDGYLHVEQHKSGSLVRLSVNLRLDVLGLSIGDVISRCRDRVVSRYMIHHARSSARARAGAPVNKQTISKGFKDARERSGLQWANPPTFHELRSLSGRLHKDQGIDAQALLGHKDARTTSLYLDSRGTEWISVG